MGRRFDPFTAGHQINKLRVDNCANGPGSDQRVTNRLPVRKLSVGWGQGGRKFDSFGQERKQDAWVVHDGRELALDANGAGAFPIIDEAAKAATLLAKLGASDQVVLPLDAVRAIASTSGINPRHELSGLSGDKEHVADGPCASAIRNLYYGRASSTRLKGVSVARLNLPKPPPVTTTSRKRRSPA